MPEPDPSAPLHWHRLADGDLLCADYPIRLIKPLRRGDGWTVKVPFDIEPGLDAGDGYWWRELLAPDSLEPLRFDRVAQAKADVAGDVSWYLRTEAGFAEDYPLDAWPTERFQAVQETAERKWREHQDWAAASPALSRTTATTSTSSKSPSKTPRAELLRLLDEAATALERTRSTTAPGADQTEALLAKIRSVVS